jgi:hypothetical protein
MIDIADADRDELLVSLKIDSFIDIDIVGKNSISKHVDVVFFFDRVCSDDDDETE